MRQTHVDYANVVRSLEKDEPVPAGFDVAMLDRRGERVAGLAAFLPGRHRIAVRRDFDGSITNASERIKAFLEPQLFRTRETVDFNLYLKVSTGHGSWQEVARRHFDAELTPEELFFRTFARGLRERLEWSALNEAGGIDERIRANRDRWQPELKAALEERFGVGVEILFDVQNEVAVDQIVRSESGDYRHVHFRDRIGKTYPLAIELRLRRLPPDRKGAALPRDEAKLKANLFDVVGLACEQHLTLYDYWFDPAAMQDVIRRHLDGYLDVHAHQVANLEIARPLGTASAPPEREEKLKAVVRWQDNRGYHLEFRAEATATIAKDGAGIYDREGRPLRSIWFEDTVSRALKHRLIGVSIVDLDDGAMALYLADVEAAVIQRAKEIGLSLQPFIGNVYLPNQKWNRPVSVEIENRRYLTADPTIAGHFSMELEISFDNRKVTETFMNEYHQSILYGERDKGGRTAGTNALPDDFIRDRLIELAAEAARSEMRQIDPNAYFTDFVTGRKWQAVIPALAPPGHQSGDNAIRTRITKALAARYPGVVLHDIRFHRMDDDLEGLRGLIARLPPIRFECAIPDHITMNAALDRRLEGYAFILSGDAEQIVWMLNKRFAEFEPEVFADAIRRHLASFVERKLFRARQEELNSLMDALTASGAGYDGAVRSALKDEIRRTVQRNFGLICGDVELIVSMSTDYEMLRAERRDRLLDPIRMNQLERDSLKTQYARLLTERETIVGTNDEANIRRQALTAEIEKVRQQMDKRQEDANEAPGAPSSQTIADATSMFVADGTKTHRTQPHRSPAPPAPGGTTIDLGSQDEDELF